LLIIQFLTQSIIAYFEILFFSLIHHCWHSNHLLPITRCVMLLRKKLGCIIIYVKIWELIEFWWISKSKYWFPIHIIRRLINSSNTDRIPIIFKLLYIRNKVASNVISKNIPIQSANEKSRTHARERKSFRNPSFLPQIACHSFTTHSYILHT
jgi:hypothetical protein